MDWDTYKTILDKIIAYTDDFSIEYRGMGEPLLNPAIYDFIKYVSNKAGTSITTNASALNSTNVHRLIEAGLGRLTISFNGDDKELYQLMMGKLSFERAQENIRTAVELCHGTHTEVAANVSVTLQTQNRLASIKQYLNDAGITNIFYAKCHSRGGYLKDASICNTPMPPVELRRCDIIKNTLFISCTGEVLSCCQDLAGENVLGDLKSDPLEPILEKRDKITAEGVNFDICKYCNDLFRFMDDQTFDGHSMSEWVYNLYSTDSRGKELKINPLSEWISKIYAQEGRAQFIPSALADEYDQLSQKERQSQQIIAALTADNQVLKKDNLTLTENIREIRSTRTWRVLDRVNRIRRRFFS